MNDAFVVTGEHKKRGYESAVSIRSRAHDQRYRSVSALITKSMTKSKTLFWNAYAQVYDQLLGTIPYQRLLKKTLDRVPAGAARLLDTGCGIGNLLNAARVRHS